MLPSHLLNAGPINAALQEISERYHTVSQLDIARDAVTMLKWTMELLTTRIDAARSGDSTVSVEQYAEMAALTPAAVRHRIRRGKLQAVRCGKRWRIPVPLGARR